MPTTVMSDFARPQSDKYESEVQSKGIVDASDGGPVKVTAMDGKKYIDAKGGINYDVGEINRNYKAGDARSGKVILNNDGDGMTEFASGLKRFNAHEQYMKHLEAQDKYSQHVEYTFDVDLKAAEGKSVDANIERERVRLAKESKAREAARQAKMAKENAKRAAKLEKDAVHGKYATIVDDDIMDEAAGRERLRLAAEGQARRQANIEALQEKQTHERRRIRQTKSKIHSWNDSWNASISGRKEEEQTLAVLLEDIRGSVQSGESRDSLHSLEKRLAVAQNWVVTPPAVTDSQFKLQAAPTSPIGWDGPEGVSPLSLIH